MDGLIAFHKNLTQIESITYNESYVGHWLAASLNSQGYKVEIHFVDEETDRANVLAFAGKKHKGIQVLVTSHIDTVWVRTQPHRYCI